METLLQRVTRVKVQNHHSAIIRGTEWGLVGGLIATLFMDIVLMGALSAFGMPPLTCFSIVGDTAARFFSVLGLAMAGGVLPGIATHYLVGPLVGTVFGIAVAQIDALQACSLRKVILLAVLHVEILAQPILATTPILLKMTAGETLQWFSGSFVMHLIFGIVLGVVLSYGLRFSVKHRSFITKPGANYSP